ncbi:MAG: serine/threonine protein kinase [Planctomycetota bacterium]
MDTGRLRDRIEELTGRRAPKRITVTGDTTEFMRVQPGHVLTLGGQHYYVEGDMREGRFGLDDDPKFWVKRCRELSTGDRKVLKLVFHEEFRIRIGLLAIHCLRDAAKEAAVLDRVRGDERFMQGYAVPDDRGNQVRIIDLIRGKSLYRRLRDLSFDHRTWFETEFPAYLAKLVGSVRAVADLHAAGLHHGDIRTDHIFIERDTERFRWIDFDLEPDVPDFDVWSLGNVLLYVVGMGEHTRNDVARRGLGNGSLIDEDASAFFPHRVMNLRKVFPYVPADLNEVLMHFSFGTRDFYETAEEFLADLEPVAARLAGEGERT